MMCDYGDDFGDDGFEDDGSMDDEPFEPEYDEHDNPDDDFSSEADSAEPCGPGWKDIAFFGAMSEALADEKSGGLSFCGKWKRTRMSGTRGSNRSLSGHRLINKTGRWKWSSDAECHS